MKGYKVPKRFYIIRNNNYLLNAYKHIIKAKLFHFIFAIVEILLNIFQEINISIFRYNIGEIPKNKFITFITELQNKIINYSSFFKFIILICYTIIFDIIYIILTKKQLSKRHKRLLLIFNILEILYFRILMLIYLNILFSLTFLYFIISFIILIPHTIIVENHFSYNHLYYFSPIFIEYPYDEFSSLYDFILLFIKILLSIILNLTNLYIKNYIFIVLLIIQILISCYLIYLLVNKSYLFMKNFFLNISKLSLFLVQTITIIIAELSGKKELFKIWFTVIIIGILIIVLFWINLKYEPMNYIKIKSETPIENLFYYFYIISDDNDIIFLLETKINEHYQKCEICNLCYKYKKYLNCPKSQNIIENGQEKIENVNNTKEENNYISDLFHVLYEHKNNYFKLINEIVINYKYNKDKFLANSSYYYINLSFLIYSEFKTDNVTLSLNIKLLLDIIIKDNKYIENQEMQIYQIIFCNNFISLANKIINQIRDILTIDYSSAKKYIDLSSSLKEMQLMKNKDVLYTNYKQDNTSNLKTIIMICSILYEEIFNITINTSQMPIRENYQILEEIFFHNMNRNNKIITLSLNLINNHCQIISAGKDLYKYKDNNLFNLFPLIFRDYQINIFLSIIIESFNIYKNNEEHSNLIHKHEIRKISSISKRQTRKIKEKKITIKQDFDYIEIKVIISESTCNKLFYKLLVLKLSPLLNCNFNSYFILFDGTYHLYNNTIMTFQNLETSRNKVQKIMAISKPELEKPPEIFSMKYQKYNTWLDKRGYFLSKIFEYKFSKKIYSIYSIHPKENFSPRRKEISSFYQRDSTGDVEVSELKSGFSPRKKTENIIEETASVVSQQKSANYISSNSGYGLKNKKKQNMYRYSSLYKIKNTLIFSVPAIFLTFILEVIHLNQLKEENISNDYSIVKFAEIYKVYFFLFSSTLSTACLKGKNGSKSIAHDYILNSKHYNFFNFSLFISAQNKLYLKELLLKRNNLINIHQNIGNEKYQEIFEEKIDYIRISKTFINGTLTLSLSNVTIPFSKAILIACNSFQIIVNNTNHEPIFILNKKDNPFLYLNENETANFSDYQKEISEMIFNYKIYKNQFININQKFIDTLASQSQKIELYIYLYLHMTLLICIYILGLLYIYLMKFEEIIIKILNFVNMIKNYKSDKFNFSIIFLEKIVNLEIILKIYSDNPLKAIQSLSSLYNRYQKYTVTQKIININNINNITNKNYKKIIEEENKKDELDIVPINQRIFKQNDLRKLYILFYYSVSFIIICFCVLIVYAIILYLWINYSKVKTNLYSLIGKNLELEISLYKVINLYDLIIFDNLTIDELSKDIFYSPEKNIYNRETLINSFYDDLHIAFDYEQEINILRKNFKNFPFFNFTCENLYEVNRENILELANYSKFDNISKVEDDLIEICKYSRLDEYNDMNAVFQKHYQDIKNSVEFIEDNSYKGLINHLKEGKLGNIVVNFNCILIYLLNIISNRMHKIEIDDLIILLENNIGITLFFTFSSYLLLILIMRWIFIRRLKIYCNQVILLKKIFRISDMQEQ